MEINFNKTDEINAVISILVQENDYSEKIEKKLKQYVQKANIPGFRPGKVPIGHIKKLYGKSILSDEVIKIVTDKLYHYIQDEKIRTVGEPLPEVDHFENIDWNNNKDFSFNFNIGLMPTFEVNYSEKKAIPYYKVSIDEKLMAKGIESYTKKFGDLNKDLTEIKGTEFLKGNLNQLNVENPINIEDASIYLKIIKEQSDLEIFTKAKLMDTVKFDIKKVFTNENDLAQMLSIKKEEIATLSPDFAYTITEIADFAPHAINQELFDKAFGEANVNSEEEFNAKIREELASEMINESEFRFKIDAKKAILDNNKFELPEEFLKRWLNVRNEKLTQEDIEMNWGNYKVEFVWQIIRSKIAEENKLTVEDADLLEVAKQRTEMQFKYYGYGKIEDSLLEDYAKKLLQNEKQASEIQDFAYENKIFKIIKEKAKLSVKEINIDDFNKLFENEK